MQRSAEDFRTESATLDTLLTGREPGIFELVTQFKQWTIGDVIGHLHMFNVAARLTLENDRAFDEFFAPVAKGMADGRTMMEMQKVWLDGLSGKPLFEAWQSEYADLVDLYAQSDPKTRVKWAGPDMSARSSITARQMETWAHGQEIFDTLGVVRTDTDRIRNIAHLGVSTFAWTFINRGESVPDPVPHIRLTAPSGEIWEWREDQADNRVEGSATGFCQTVTQTRNVADTDIIAVGDPAQKWMATAQCFAGAPHLPPEPGERHRVRPK